MTTEQQQQMLAFIVNLVYHLLSEGMPREYVEQAAQMGASSLLVTVFGFQSPRDEPEAEAIAMFMRECVNVSMQRYAAPTRVPLQA